MSAGTAAALALAICTFFIGAGVGVLTEKWCATDELRTLRAQTHELASSGKVCCDAAYVAIRYRPGCPEVKP